MTILVRAALTFFGVAALLGGAALAILITATFDAPIASPEVCMRFLACAAGAAFVGFALTFVVGVAGDAP